MQCYRDLFCIRPTGVAFPVFSHNLPKDIWNELLQYLRRDDLDVICLASRRLRKLVVENANHLPLRNLGTVFLVRFLSTLITHHLASIPRCVPLSCYGKDFYIGFEASAITLHLDGRSFRFSAFTFWTACLTESL